MESGEKIERNGGRGFMKGGKERGTRTLRSGA